MWEIHFHPSLEIVLGKSEISTWYFISFKKDLSVLANIKNMPYIIFYLLQSNTNTSLIHSPSHWSLFLSRCCVIVGRTKQKTRGCYLWFEPLPHPLPPFLTYRIGNPKTPWSGVDRNKISHKPQRVMWVSSSEKKKSSSTTGSSLFLAYFDNQATYWWPYALFNRFTIEKTSPSSILVHENHYVDRHAPLLPAVRATSAGWFQSVVSCSNQFMKCFFQLLFCFDDV